MVKNDRSALIPKTPSLALVRSLANTRTQTQSWTLERKSSLSSKSSTQKALRRTALKDSSESSSSEEELPTDEALRDGARQKARLLDTCFDAWHHDKIANGIAGWVTRVTMICDLPKNGKTQPNHPNPMGPPLDYMGECWIFDAYGWTSMTYAASTPWG